MSRQTLRRQSHSFHFPGGIISYILKRFTGLPYVITAHGSDVPDYNPNRFRLLHGCCARCGGKLSPTQI